MENWKSEIERIEAAREVARKAEAEKQKVPVKTAQEKHQEWLNAIIKQHEDLVIEPAFKNMQAQKNLQSLAEKVWKRGKVYKWHKLEKYYTERQSTGGRGIGDRYTFTESVPHDKCHFYMALHFSDKDTGEWSQILLTANIPEVVTWGGQISSSELDTIDFLSTYKKDLNSPKVIVTRDKLERKKQRTNLAQRALDDSDRYYNEFPNPFVEDDLVYLLAKDCEARIQKGFLKE